MIDYYASDSRVSIIIPVYKVEEYLDECIESVIRQSYQSIEIILVDDGSPDQCPAICDEYAEKDSRVKVIHQKNGGLSAARNSGIKMAKGDYIAFIDSDDYIAENFIEKLFNCAIDTNADIVCCGMTVIGNGRALIHTPDSVKCYTTDRISLLLQEHGTGDYYMNKLFRRDILEGFELPVGKLYEDIYSMHFLYAKAKKVAWLNASLYYYRINETGISHNKKLNPRFIEYVYANRSQYEYIKKCFSEFENMSLKKYAGAIAHAAEVYTRRADRDSLPELLAELTRLSTEIVDKVANNDVCSSQVKHEIGVISDGAKRWIKYYRFRERVKRVHNHPRIQSIFAKLLKWDFIPTED